MTVENRLLGRLVRDLRKQQGLSRKKLSTLGGVSFGWLGAIEQNNDGRGGTPHPSPQILQGIARGLATHPHDETVDAQLELEYYDQLMEAAGYLERGAPRTTPPRGYQPVVNARTTVAAGGFIIEPTQAGGIAVEDSFATGRDLIQITVTGSCLDPDLRHGEVVIVDRARKDPRPGNFVIVLTPDGELMVKRFDIRPEGPILEDNEGNTWRPNGSKIEGVVVASWRRHS